MNISTIIANAFGMSIESVIILFIGLTIVSILVKVMERANDKANEEAIIELAKTAVANGHFNTVEGATFFLRNKYDVRFRDNV